MPVPSKERKEWSDEVRNFAALGYVPVICLIVLLLKKDHPFICFHAKQGLLICLCFFLFWYLPWIGKMLNLFLAAFMFVGLVKAKAGEYWKVPVLGNLAEKIRI